MRTQVNRRDTMVIRLIKNKNEERKTFKNISVNTDCKLKKKQEERDA